MPCSAHAAGQSRVLGEEAVARIDRVGAGELCDPNDLFDREVRAHGMAPLADLVALVRLLAVQRVAVLEGEDRYRGDAEFVGGPKGANSDLAAVRDE